MYYRIIGRQVCYFSTNSYCVEMFMFFMNVHRTFNYYSRTILVRNQNFPKGRGLESKANCDCILKVGVWRENPCHWRHGVWSKSSSWWAIFVIFQKKTKKHSIHLDEFCTFTTCRKFQKSNC